MDVQRRPGPDGGLKDAQGSAGGMLRRLQARIARHAGARGNNIASQEVGHGYIITPLLVPRQAFAIQWLTCESEITAR
jgi:hypothetical protein